MSTNPPPLLDFESLLSPVPGADPAGSNLPFLIRERLDAARREINPDDYDANDPQRPAAAKKADWAAILDLSQDVLRGTSKDVSVAARLTEALVKMHGLPGLGTGLQLLRMMVEQCWDRLSPVLEADDDIEIRAAPFRWLDEPSRGAAFPNTIRAIPLVVGNGSQFGWQDWRRSQDPRSGLTEAFDRARQDMNPELSRQSVELLSAAREQFDGMVKALNERMGESAPAMLGMRQALDDCQLLAQQILQLNDTGPPPEPEAPAADASEEVTTPGTTASGRRAVTRSQIYAQLADAANALRRLEPHSPIPYLLDRAVELGGLSFPALIKELVRDANVLATMSRELGIKDTPPDQ